MIIPAGYAQANFRFTGVAVPEGAEITMGLNVGTFGSTPAAAAQECIDAWQTADMDAMQVVTCTLSSVLVKFGPAETGPSAEVGTNTPGTNPADGLPPNTAYLIQKQTALGGRAGRGRFFIPAIPENNVAETGLLVPTALANLTTRVNNFYAALVASDIEPVVLHGPTSPLVLPTPVTAFVTQAKVATQRRRLRR